MGVDQGSSPGGVENPLQEALDANNNDISNVKQFDTGVSRTESEPHYNVKHWGAVGDGSTDDTDAIQSAINAAASGGGGRVYFPTSTYLVSQSGIDAGGYDFALRLKSGVRLVGDGWGSYIKVAGSEPKVSPILAENETDIGVESLAVDAGYHTQPQSDDADQTHSIKFGTETEGNGCSQWFVRDCYVTGGFRHGFEATAGSSIGLVERCLFDDASGDDDLSINLGSTDITARDCWSINKQRDGTWAANCFEVDDDCHRIHFDSLYAISPVNNGFLAPKSHTGDPVCSNVWLTNCYSYNAGGSGFVVSPFGDGTLRDSGLINCHAISPNASGIQMGGTTTVEDFVIRDCTIDDAGNKGVVFLNSSTLIRPKITNTTIRDTNQDGIAFDTDAGLTVDSPIVRENTIVNAGNDAVALEGASSNYQGLGFVERNHIRGANFTEIAARDDVGVRQYVITRDNYASDDDFCPVEPAIGIPGLWYADDGTNTGSGTSGLRIYLGGSWQDWVTA